MTAEKLKAASQRAVKPMKWAALVGAVLALACHLVPPDYRAVCEVLASICTGGGK